MPAAGSRVHTPRARLAATDGGARAGTRRGARDATALPFRTPTAALGGNCAVAIGMSAAGSRVDTPRARLAATDGGARAGTRRGARGATALPVRTPKAALGGKC